jgi:glutathione S-transferase
MNPKGCYRIYGDAISGNCYKIKLLMELLRIPYEWIAVDILAGEARTEAFLAMNPNGKTPVIQLPEGQFLAESNAILNYLAEGTAFLPAAGIERAKVLEWQFFEQYSHEPYIAVARFINKYLGLPETRREEYEAKQPGGHKALALMERQLEQTTFLVGEQATIADISLFAYTQVAHEGGFDLSGYPQINAWMQRIRALPGYQPM